MHFRRPRGSGGGPDEAPRILTRRVLDALAEGIVVHGPDGTVVDVNRTACELLGLTRDELVGRAPSALGGGAVHEDGTPFPAEEHPAMVTLRTGQPQSDVVIGVGPDGPERRWLSVSARPLDEDGRRVGAAATFVEISERLKAARSLKLSQDRYRLLAENASDVVCQLGLDGTIRWVSPSATRVLGWAPEQMIGRRGREFIAEEDRGLSDARVADLREQRGVITYEARFITATGERRWMSVRARAAVDEHGTIVAAVVGLRDCEAEVATRRAADTLSAANAILASSPTEDRLLHEMCEAAVSAGGYMFAWYGRPLDDPGRTVAKVATSAAHREYIDSIVVSWGSGPTGQGPTGRALRSGRTNFANDFGDDAVSAPWREQALAHGLRAVVSVPVHVNGAVDGVFVVYAAEASAFDPAALALLEDLAREVGLGLARIRDAERLDQVVRDLVRLRTAIDQTSEAIVVTDTVPAIVYANPSALRSSGRQLDEVIGQNPRIFSSGLHDQAFYRGLWRSLRNGETWSGVITNRRKDGSLYEEDTTITPVHDEQGFPIAYVSVKRDLTVERRLEADLSRAEHDRKAIVELMEQVQPSENLEGTVRSFTQAVRQLDGIDRCMVLLIGPDDRLVPVGVGVSALPWVRSGSTIKVSDREALLTAVAKGPFSVDLASAETSAPLEQMFPGLRKSLLGIGLTAVACAPIRRRRETIGLLWVGSTGADGVARLESRLRAVAELGTYAGTLFGPEADQHLWREAQRAELRNIIDGRRFHPVFQPVVELATGRVCGYEALTRFHDGKRPDLRFAAAHTFGLGAELEAACASAAVEAARSLPPDTWLSVNVSPMTLLAGGVAKVVAAADRPIVLEITEHARIDSYAAVRAAVAACGPVRLSSTTPARDTPACATSSSSNRTS